MSETAVSTRLRPADLRAFCVNVLTRVGVSNGDADTVADVLVESDLQGRSTHGLGLLAFYVPALKRGGINPGPAITPTRDEGATVLLDADGALGQLAGVYGARLAIERARIHGLSLIGVRNSRHWGAAAYYVSLIARERMIGIAITLAAGNTMAPSGGLDYLVGNNPIAIATPAGRHLPPVLDMALSVTSRGRIMQAAERGTAIPPGWATDRAGRATTDAREAIDGLLQPIGDYKGYALSMMLSLLAGTLTGAPIGRRAAPLFDPEGDSGHLLAAVDIARFRDPEAFEADVDRFVDELHESERMPGVDRILVPGERRQEIARHNRTTGVPVDELYLAKLDQIAGELGISKIARNS